jgi:aminomethyltransferase
MSVLTATPLLDRHHAAGARMVPFSGWELPVRYGSVTEEHLAVRARAGVFDVSHMGQIETRGPGAAALLQRLLSNDVSKLAIGGAQYGLLCRDDGGVLDDLFTYRLGADRFLTVTNAANHARDLAWFVSLADGFDAAVDDRAAEYAMLAVQGPAARALVAQLADGPLPARFLVAERRVGAARALVCGTGYTGEDGVELLTDPADVPELWDALVAGGARPAGLAARDTLRLEVGYHLYGNDLTEERGPIEAGLGWACKEHTGFIGADAVRAARDNGPADRLVAFTLETGIPRQGNPIAGGGVVTSGTISPSLGHGIGMGYVPAALAAEGTWLEIDGRGRTRAARVAPRPLYRGGSA